ncbi:hypothetical protein IQ07DRAFT_72532 [Pyrenochaeta sp. DS3sAY3a]|nr:hypothetical protein IQ07DRAFT_72532 [Pyrenochaeta sp. DS3sAY3a]
MTTESEGNKQLSRARQRSPTTTLTASTSLSVPPGIIGHPSPSEAPVQALATIALQAFSPLPPFAVALAILVYETTGQRLLHTAHAGLLLSERQHHRTADDDLCFATLQALRLLLVQCRLQQNTYPRQTRSPVLINHGLGSEFAGHHNATAQRIR